MTSKRSLRFNFVVLTLFLGTAAGLFLILGVTQLMWFVANNQVEIGFFIWMLCFIGAGACVWGIMKFTRKLLAKMKEMVS